MRTPQTYVYTKYDEHGHSVQQVMFSLLKPTEVRGRRFPARTVIMGVYPIRVVPRVISEIVPLAWTTQNTFKGAK